eukprot:scpid85774/ scgid30353/ Pyroglutamyl-peptidase 1; 5-oxoprolyl-peptidase; Pyroglutamyl aminopeptidase I; Pyroglutamyl-peptidase I; Pyrrolidone-carboxylate peptidase
MGKTILVTGFGPFKGHPVNASWEAVKELESIGLHIDGFDLVIKDIPVLYKEVSEMVPSLWKEHDPVLVIHVGVDGGGKAVTLEECAVNIGHDTLDVERKLPPYGCCVEGGCGDLHCKMDLDDVCKRCVDQASCDGLKVVFRTSHDAGRYLCNFSYYCSLSLDKAPSLFVHVPPLSKPFSCNELAQALRLVVRSCLQASGQL